MTEEDIKRQLECRMAIDAHKEFKTQYYDSHPTLKRKNIIVKGELVSVKFTPELDTSLNNMYNVLKKNKFVDEKGKGSLQAFKEWYEPLILEVFTECNPISGSCDKCGIEEIKDQMCFKRFDDACVHTMPIEVTSLAYKLSLTVGIMNGGLEKDCVIIDGKMWGPSWSHRCLPGHGFYMLISDQKQPPEGVDLYWKF